MTSRILQFRVNRAGIGLAFSLLVLLLATSPAAAYIYWQSVGVLHLQAIGRANLHGTGIKLRFINAGGAAGGMAVDGRYVYWSTGWISRARRNGTGEHAFIKLPGYHYAVAVAVDHHHIYWFDEHTSKIGRANLNGTGANQRFVSASPGTLMIGLAVDHSHVYWLDTSPSTRITWIARANIDGRHVERNFIQANADFDGLALDGKHIYWSTATGHGVGTIARADIDGHNVIPDFLKTNDSVCGTMAVFRNHIYWSGRQGIARANLDGTDIKPSFVPIGEGFCGVAVDGLGP